MKKIFLVLAVILWSQSVTAEVAQEWDYFAFYAGDAVETEYEIEVTAGNLGQQIWIAGRQYWPIVAYTCWPVEGRYTMAPIVIMVSGDRPQANPGLTMNMKLEYIGMLQDFKLPGFMLEDE